VHAHDDVGVAAQQLVEHVEVAALALRRREGHSLRARQDFIYRGDWYLKSWRAAAMHGAFDVSLHNKRFALFPAPRGCAAAPAERGCAAAPEGARRLEAGAASVPAARDEPEKGRMGRLAKLRAAGLPVLYLLLVASDYVGPPRVHGSKLAVVLVAGGPTALLVLQARGERLPCLLAVVLAHLVVTACFVADARRLQRDLVAVPTLGALGAGLFALAAGGVAADPTPRGRGAARRRGSSGGWPR